MSESRPDFRRIKQSASLLDVLARYKVELRGTNVFEFAADGRIARLDSFNDAGAAAEWLAEKRP